MKYVLVLDVAKGKSMFMLSSNIGECIVVLGHYSGEIMEAISNNYKYLDFIFRILNSNV